MCWVTVVFLLAGSVCNADEHSEKFITEVRSRIAAIEKERTEVSKQVKAMESGRIVRTIDTPFTTLEVRGTTRYVWRTREEKDKAITQAKQRLESLAEPSRIVPTLPFANQFAVGMIGAMPETTSESVFVRIADTGTTTAQHTFYRCIAFQVLDANRVLVKHEAQTATFADQPAKVRSEIFLLNTSTAGMVDGQRIAVTGVHKVTGTHQYESTNGVRTVFAVESFDASDLIKQAKQQPAS